MLAARLQVPGSRVLALPAAWCIGVMPLQVPLVRFASNIGWCILRLFSQQHGSDQTPVSRARCAVRRVHFHLFVAYARL